DTTKPGFKVRTVQARADVNLPDGLTRAEAQLAGTLIDPTTGQPYVNHAIPGPNADGSYDVEGVIHYVANGGGDGNFDSGTDFPGLPGDEGSQVSSALEALTFIKLSKGFHKMGVNSDDGFRVQIGNGVNARDAFATVLGQYDGGRGADNTI